MIADLLIVSQSIQGCNLHVLGNQEAWKSFSSSQLYIPDMYYIIKGKNKHVDMFAGYAIRATDKTFNNNQTPV